ncbi:glutaredoxin [Neurospora tetraspora]|uniref:Glutaredoxin n=1 Tax=Neurospora tetraspora TaxID=94610 RepID=A0AAE0MJH9_9PEZI|nr:glutaredoxin [Neurospora tetraspora]
MSTIKDITSIEAWNDHVSSLPASTLLIVSFHAPWAAPCAQMATVLKTLASEYPVTEPLSTSWVSIDAEELSEISETYNVTAVPFLVLARNGQVLETVSGSSAVKVRNAIETHANKSAQSGTEASEKTPAAANGAATAEGQAGDVVPQDPEKQKEELFKRLGDLVKAAPVMLFMKGTPSEPKCGFSRQLVALLRENAVKYGFFNILADDEVRQGLKEFADWPTYPQLWVDGELVGGLDIVREAYSVSSYRQRTNYEYRSRRSWRTTPTSSSHIVSRRTAMRPRGSPRFQHARKLPWWEGEPLYICS